MRHASSASFPSAALIRRQFRVHSSRVAYHPHSDLCKGRVQGVSGQCLLVVSSWLQSALPHVFSFVAFGSTSTLLDLILDKASSCCVEVREAKEGGTREDERRRERRRKRRQCTSTSSCTDKAKAMGSYCFRCLLASKNSITDRSHVSAARVSKYQPGLPIKAFVPPRRA